MVMAIRLSSLCASLVM